ncbi:hypothetical protein TNCV_712001 [Trichonephila clavipes]|nr:hypothetical protein TNCV_712001 [Trichonephila clavipes]
MAKLPAYSPTLMDVAEQPLQGDSMIWPVSHPNFEREHSGGDQGPHISLPLPPTSREDLRLEWLIRVSPCRTGIIHL